MAGDTRDLIARAESVIRESEHADEHAELLTELVAWIGRYDAALRNLVERADTTELRDGSNLDTRAAHALLDALDVAEEDAHA